MECPFFTQHGDVTNDGRNALHVAAQAGQGHINYFWGEIAGDLFFFFKVSSFRLVKFVNLRGQRYSMTSFVKGLDL